MLYVSPAKTTNKTLTVAHQSKSVSIRNHTYRCTWKFGFTLCIKSNLVFMCKVEFSSVFRGLVVDWLKNLFFGKISRKDGFKPWFHLLFLLEILFVYYYFLYWFKRSLFCELRNILALVTQHKT